MNRDRNIISRALQRAGQEALTDEDITAETVKWRTCRDFYLPVLLSTLSETEWTCLKVRAALALAPGENFSPYLYAYTLPADCAKPIEVQRNDEFIIEGNTLYTDRADAVLLYITNGKIADAADYITGDDYPEYRALIFSPSLTECLEYKLAATVALKITGDSNQYRMLYAAATQIESQAWKTSKSQGSSRQNGNPWWSEKLGLTTEGKDGYAHY